MAEPTPQSKNQRAVPEWVDGQVLGVTKSGKNFTTWRWWNELFKLLAIREKSETKTQDLYTHPAHLSTDKYESPDYDGGRIWITNRIDHQAYRDWLDNLESKGYIRSEEKDGETEWSLTRRGNKILSHVMERAEHEFRDGVCEVCYGQNWVDFDADLDRLVELIESPKSNPAQEIREKAAQNGLVDAELIQLLKPSEDSIAKSFHQIGQWLKDNHDGWEDRSYSERNGALESKLESLKEKGEICYSDRLRGYTWPSFEIRYEDGEIESVNVGQESFIQGLFRR